MKDFCAKNFVHETHIVFENLSNIKRDMLQKAWGLNIGEGGLEETFGDQNWVKIGIYHFRQF